MLSLRILNSVFIASAILVVVPTAGTQCVAADDKETTEPSLKLGQELFKRDWSKHKPTRGDGLGPMFNAVSCVECHKMGGVGGAGGLKHNVDLLTLISHRPKKGNVSPRLLKRIRTVHPDLNASQLTVTLHKSGYRRDENTVHKDPEYDRFRKSFLDRGKSSSLQGEPEGTQRLRRSRMLFEMSHRSTPALFGAGLIDQIPDSVLIKLARHQKENVTGVSGRVPQTPTGAVGRFGWRGQIASLHEFVLGACVNELGLQVDRNRPEPTSPVAALEMLKKTGKLPPPRSPERTIGERQVDLTEHECRSLTAFVADLAAPEQLNGTSLAQSEAALDGEKLFAKIGCSDCHVKDLGPATGIYSDLLLHDMGPDLADSVSAVPEIDEESTPFFGGYSGGFVTEQLVRVTTNIRQEWKTPPLWGVADSAPYLHDGRALSIDEAIRMHGGEAAASARRFRGLGATDRDRVIAFLSTLAPKGAKPRVVFFPRAGRFPGPRRGALGSGFFSIEDELSGSKLNHEESFECRSSISTSPSSR